MIYTIGETVFDVIFENEKPQNAIAGGAMLNTSVSLGRIGLFPVLISEVGQDIVGDIIDSFLIKNGVDTSYIYRFKTGRTALALAFLNDKMDAAYSFYKDYPPLRLAITQPSFSSEDRKFFIKSKKTRSFRAGLFT